MGSSLQEILPGRGDKKGKGHRVKRGIPPLFVFLLWLALIADFPVTRPSIWAAMSVAAVTPYLFLVFHKKRTDLSAEFLFAALTVLAGIITALKLPWLQLALFPAIMGVAYFFPLRAVLCLSALIPAVGMKDAISAFIPFFQLKAPVSSEVIIEEAAFSLFLMLAALLSGVMVDRWKKEREELESSLRDIRDKAKGITREAEMESLSDDEMMSHYVASARSVDDEIKELLLTIKRAVLSDSANFFVPCSGGFELRCTTEGRDAVFVNGGGVVAKCLNDRKPFSSGELDESKTDPGYRKAGKMKITSVIAVPLVEGSAVSGVLTVDSSRYQAFSGIEGTEKTIRMFSDHLVRVLERHRISMALKRELSGLKILERESSSLVASLKIDEISEKLCKVAEKISGAQSFFFLGQGKNFELKHHSGAASGGADLYDLRGTIVNFAIENKHRHYIPDLREYPAIRIMPFETRNVLSVMAVPMIYENNILGLLVMLSPEKDFLDGFRINLLDIFCNQASTSLANAQLHAKIERMATTDGLTGLFNHRLFQEKLSGEFKRLKRFPEPISLILSDIDHFKKVNDTYGHPIGDIVLKGVARVIRETIRDIDIPARYGGEEFAVILPGTSGEGAGNIAERLRQKVKERPFSANGKLIEVSISIGIATSPFDAKSKEELIERADQALYHAKHGGRNRSVLWSSIQ